MNMHASTNKRSKSPDKADKGGIMFSVVIHTYMSPLPYWLYSFVARIYHTGSIAFET